MAAKKRIPKAIKTFHHKLGWEGFTYAIREWDWRSVKRVDPTLFAMIKEIKDRAKVRKFKPGSILERLRQKYGLGAPQSPMQIAASMGIRI